MLEARCSALNRVAHGLTGVAASCRVQAAARRPLHPGRPAPAAREGLESHGIHESCSESLVLGKTRLESLGLEQDSTSNPGGQGFKGFVNLGLESRPPAATLIRP